MISPILSPLLVQHSLNERSDLSNLANTDYVGEKNLEDIKSTSKELESVFINQLLSAMRKTVIKSDLFGDDQANEYYTSMLDEFIATDIAQREPLGISKLIIDNYMKNME